ncbi:DUF2164 domain-containing protein [Pelagicoccus sp. SDUM812002]|uniref:DUF2164 domain-containing protein n=1 Tax=Pelagicoccus sp. SDUM812002 TaxID=3041266 RepID=UPI00280DE76B|nr:DUF2164 domain-containing protein [Pelagicoccus sp. SDUM812002]MDQ8186026.1 DUF2164 domain-containing protein [Pelagicoccus sp. SDUM812002]
MPIEISKDQMACTIPAVQQFIQEEFEIEIGELKARFLIEFFAKEIGPLAFNQGVDEAEAYFRAKIEDLKGACFEPKE